MPDEDQLFLRPSKPPTYDEWCHSGGDLEFLIRRVNRLPDAADLWRAAVLIGLIGAILGIVGIELIWRYFRHAARFNRLRGLHTAARCVRYLDANRRRLHGGYFPARRE